MQIEPILFYTVWVVRLTPHAWITVLTVNWQISRASQNRNTRVYTQSRLAWLSRSLTKCLRVPYYYPFIPTSNMSFKYIFIKYTTLKFGWFRRIPLIVISMLDEIIPPPSIFRKFHVFFFQKAACWSWTCWTALITSQMAI